MKGQNIKILKEVIDEEVMVDYQDILFEEMSVMPVIKTVIIKGALSAATVLGVTTDL